MPRGKRWAMTERGRSQIDRSDKHIAIGPSSMAWSDRQLTIDIEEWSVPVPSRVRGTITIDLGPMFEDIHDLDSRGRHTWRPIAPCALATVRFDKPALSWQGRAYVDMNAGTEPLEAGFRNWTWSREDAGASTRILYDVQQRDGARRGLALDYRPDGSIRHIDLDPVQGLPRTGWHVSRSTRATEERPARLLRTLEDTPFYSRSVLAFERHGETRNAINESVDLDRFAARWVQMLLPFKMPRRAG
jgi:carotenoid 1,2-hydratase